MPYPNLIWRHRSRTKHQLISTKKQLGRKGCAIIFIKWLYNALVLKNGVLSNKSPFIAPPVLLMSYPRSGSSWAGDVLGSSPDIAYMREPVGLSVKSSFKWSPYNLDTVGFDNPFVSRELFFYHRKYADMAFNGVPPVSLLNAFSLHGNAMCIYGFPSFNRKGKRLLIKEVRPSALRFYTRCYAPKVILLIRHPCAILDSFNRLGWIPPTADWERRGYNLGGQMSDALSGLEGTDSVVVQYEHLAQNPVSEFSKLFTFMELPVPQNFGDIVNDFCQRDKPYGAFYTRRVSSEQINKWRKNLDRKSIDLILKGYRRSNFPYYREVECIS